VVDQSRKQVGQDQCRCSWDNGKARCGQKVAGVGDGDKARERVKVESR
jgi:hypothetical protein